MEEQSRFQQLVTEAKKNITEVLPTEARADLERSAAILIDVRDGDEWGDGHATGARHLSRGTIEIEIEEAIPDSEQPIICYCGGGGRSALVAESLQKMGYKNVRSLAGGFKAWAQAGMPTEK